MPRLPAKIPLPFSYVIRVVLTSDREMLEVMEEDDPSELADGLWDVDTRTIYAGATWASSARPRC